MCENLKPGYKASEVGVIPEDWEARSLVDICWFQEGPGVRSHQFVASGVKLLNGTNIFDGRVVLDSTNRYISKAEAYGAYRHFLVDEGDILIASSGVSIDKFHEKVAFTRNDALPLCMNTSTIRFKPDARHLVPNYLYFLLQSYLFKTQIGTQATGSAQLNFGPSHIAKVSFPLPPQIGEQRLIAEALADIDNLTRGVEQLIAKKRHIKQGAMQELLTGKKRLPGFRGEWEVKLLGAMGNCYRGVSYNPNADLSAFDLDSTIRLLRSNNVQDAKVVFSDMQFVDSRRVSDIQRLRPNDILICMANGSRNLVGKAARFSANDGFAYTFGAFMGCFRPDTQAADAKYIFYLFQTEVYRIHIDILLAGSSINNLRPSDLEAFSIPFRVQREEQEAIATILSDMDAEIAALEVKLGKYRQIKQGMMQELLTGRIRLV